jgi:hypothetical protein
VKELGRLDRLDSSSFSLPNGVEHATLATQLKCAAQQVCFQNGCVVKMAKQLSKCIAQLLKNQ